MIKNVIGIDIGGTKTHIGLFEVETWKLLKEKKIPSKSQEGFEYVLSDIVDLIKELGDASTVGVGIGVPGYINPKTGIVYKTPNIKLDEPMNIIEFFKNKIDLPVFADNDANLFAFAEYELHRKDNIKNMVGLTLGTGLGGGVIINGELYHGHKGFAAEFGHIVVDGDKELEDFVSGKGNDKTRGKYLGITISNLIHIFNPELVVLGGSVSKSYDDMKDDMWEVIKERNIYDSYNQLEIHVSELDSPGTLGAAILACNKLKNA